MKSLVKFVLGVILIAVLSVLVSPIPTYAAVAKLTVVNNSAVEIYTLKARPSGRTAWGSDILGRTTTIPVGGTWTGRLTTGKYDLQASARDGSVVTEIYNVSLTEPYIWTLNLQVHYSLTNYQDEEICYVYIVPSGSNDWGADWLGSSETISVGATWATSLDAGNYDMKLENCRHEALDITYDMHLYNAEEHYTTP